jgi:hypothetical protein
VGLGWQRLSGCTAGSAIVVQIKTLYEAQLFFELYNNLLLNTLCCSCTGVLAAQDAIYSSAVLVLSTTVSACSLGKRVSFSFKVLLVQ